MLGIGEFYLDNSYYYRMKRRILSFLSKEGLCQFEVPFIISTDHLVQLSVRSLILSST